jgi:two-component sensor histidine kinase
MELDIQSLKESKAFLKDLYENVTSAIFLADKEARIQHFNDSFRVLFEGTEKEIVGALCGNAIKCCFPIEEGRDCGQTTNCPECRLRANILKSMAERKPVYGDSLERDFIFDGVRKHKHLRFTTKFETYRGLEYVLVLVDDVTEMEERNRELACRNRRLEELLAAETKELMSRAKELKRLGLEREELQREVHHRVGNNLQVISSLLNLSDAGPGGEEAAVLFKNRIGAVIEVYKHSVYEGGTATVHPRGLVQAIALEAVEAFGEPRLEAEVRVDLENLRFDLAVPLGIVLGELIRECMAGKAASGRATLHIYLESSEGEAELRVVARGPAQASAETTSSPRRRAEDRLRPSQGAGSLAMARLLAAHARGRIEMQSSVSSSECEARALFAFPLAMEDAVGQGA